MSRTLKEAIDWAIGQAAIWRGSSDAQEPARTYMAENYTLLANAAQRPALPEHPDDELICVMVQACAVHINDPMPVMRNIYSEIVRHLMEPRTKTVDVWRVDYVHRGEPRAEPFTERWRAEERAGELEANRDGSREQPAFACIAIVGPYKQQVPA